MSMTLDSLIAALKQAREHSLDDIDGESEVRADLLATVRREEREAAGFNLSSDDVKDLREILTNAADDLDTEGLGDTDSCIDARRWAKRFEEYKSKKGDK